MGQENPEGRPKGTKTEWAKTSISEILFVQKTDEPFLDRSGNVLEVLSLLLLGLHLPCGQGTRLTLVRSFGLLERSKGRRIPYRVYQGQYFSSTLDEEQANGLHRRPRTHLPTQKQILSLYTR